MKNLQRNLLGSLCMCLALQACTPNPDPAKVAGDVAKAQADGQKLIADARANLQKVAAENNKNIVDAQVDARNAPPSTTAVTPGSSATPATTVTPTPATNDVAAARNDANDKIADAQLALDKATAEAMRNVSQAQCGLQAGDMQKGCNETAKAKYDADVAAAKSRRDSLQHPAAG